MNPALPILTIGIFLFPLSSAVADPVSTDWASPCRAILEAAQKELAKSDPWIADAKPDSTRTIVTLSKESAEREYNVTIKELSDNELRERDQLLEEKWLDLLIDRTDSPAPDETSRTRHRNHLFAEVSGKAITRRYRPIFEAAVEKCLALTPAVVQKQSVTTPWRGRYRGMEKMENLNPEKKKARWFHENTLVIDNDKIRLAGQPVEVIGKEKTYSASDGGFPVYEGTVEQTEDHSTTRAYVHWESKKCDYCMIVGTIRTLQAPSSEEKEPRLELIALPNGTLRLNGVIYHRIASDEK